jgi:aryl-alcohol dehydrogenase-like predicted oxidoreductase
VRTRALGKTGIDVSELALGTWGLSGDAYGPIVDSEVERTIDRAIALGITLFDTADVYGRGSIERRLGKRLPADATYVCTKIGTDLESQPYRKHFDPAYLRTAFERSQERLARDPVDIVLLHNPSEAALASDEASAFLTELKTKGRIRAWGVSAGTTGVARAALARGADVLELAYNAYLAHDLHELASDVSEKGAGVLARSVLAHGVLAGHWTADREFYAGDHRAERWTRSELRRRIEQLEALRPCLGGAVVSLRAAALRFVLSNELVSSAVLGPRSVPQLEALVREAGNGPPYLRDVVLADLGRRLKNVGVAI